VDTTLTYADKLVRALRAPDGALVVHAAHTLGALRDPRAVEALEYVVWHGDPYAAAEAVRALAHIGTPAATRDVAAAADHPSVIVRTAAGSVE